MKTWMLICQGMADEPVEALSGRTPLEAAKTPNLDLLAKKGRLGSVSFVPSALEARSEVACLAALGYDPEEFYTGLAPLECMGMGLSQNDQEIAFRCDLVTALDEILIDVTAGSISDREGALLIKELQSHLLSPQLQFHPGTGYRNILMVKDSEMLEALDDMELPSPRFFLEKKIKKSRGQGQAQLWFSELLEKASVLLETHEINRVRIDLKENPANRVWLWGQGRRPKLLPFKGRFQMEAQVQAEEAAVRGIGRAMEAAVSKKIDFAQTNADFSFIYFGSEINGARINDLKSKIKWIEDFDSQVVAPVVKMMQGSDPLRVGVAADLPHSFEKKGYQRGHVPFLIAGHGIEAQHSGVFSEKNCSQSPVQIEKGYLWINELLK